MTRRTAAFVLAAAFLAALPSSNLIAADPPQKIAVVVNTADGEASGNQFFVVDTARADVVKDLQNVLRKSSDLLVTNQQASSASPVTVIVGIKNACISTGADVYPDKPALAKEMFWVIDTENSVITNTGAATKPARFVRYVRGTGRDRPAAVDMVAKDFIAWVAANRSTLLAGK